MKGKGGGFFLADTPKEAVGQAHTALPAIKKHGIEYRPAGKKSVPGIPDSFLEADPK